MPGFAWRLSFGVDLFFVLSGYLITEIIIAHKDRPHFLLNFYMRRSLRIWPLYYATVISLALFYKQMPVIHFVRFLTFTQSLPLSGELSQSYRALAPTWSLAVEEQFYLVWPLLAIVLSRRALTGVVLGLLPLPLILRVITNCDEFNIAVRGQGLLLGALLVLVLRHWDERDWSVKSRLGWLLAIAAVCIPGPFVARALIGTEGVLVRAKLPLEALCFDVIFACGVGMLVLLSGRPWLRPMRNPFLCRVGLISYGIYMCHVYVIMLFERFLPPSFPPALGMVLEVAAAYGVAELTWRFLEQPFLALKDKFGYRG